jgi:3-hydroxybutyryl-CoA dehydratase
MPAATVQQFETDFWKDAKSREVWDEIVPGEQRKDLALYARLGGHRPVLQGDRRNQGTLSRRSRGESRPLRGLVAPPSIHILLMFCCTPAVDWMRSPGTVNADQSWSYNISARPGDVITLQARALDKFIKRERLFVVHDNVFLTSMAT